MEPPTRHQVLLDESMHRQLPACCAVVVQFIIEQEQDIKRTNDGIDTHNAPILRRHIWRFFLWEVKKKLAVLGKVCIFAL